ncbi:MAG TPA: sigma-70 family RNA polymerase sigma factor [Candidatus Binatia bacterium]|nr:sigma-70 family RNA polymerase sigma factor [Candidatus Binatia bacterium]
MRSSEMLRPLDPPGRQFNTTHWSVVLLAGQNESQQGAEALEKLCRTYWPPLYGFIRRQGYGPEDAQDLTQKFFALLLERKDFGAVDPRKGKFRTFLLTSLTHFLANERDWSKAAKRGGGQQIISLNALESEQRYGSEPSVNVSPDKLFDLRWATTVLEEALRKLQAEMTAGGKSRQFEQLKLYLTDEPGEGDYTAAGVQLAMSSQAVAVAVHRLRNRYRELVRTEVAQTVANPLETDEEMRHLHEVLTESL